MGASERFDRYLDASGLQGWDIQIGTPGCGATARADVAAAAQERGADGRAHGPAECRVRATSRCITSWPTRTGRTSEMLLADMPVGRAADGFQRRRLVDHRRHGVSQAGAALGGRGAPVLRDAGQAGQLPGGGERVAGLRGGQHSGGVAAVPAPGVGRRPRPDARRPACPKRSSSPPSRRSRCSRSSDLLAQGAPQALRAGRRRLRRGHGVSRDA